MEIKILKIERIYGEDKFKNPTTTLDLTYESGGVEGKQRIVPFANPSVFKTLDGASVNESFDVAVSKNAKGYDVWSSIGAVGTIKATPATKVLGSNYETPDERALKQRYIVRQSSIANALTYFNFNTDKLKLNVVDVLEVAKQFEEYIFSPLESL
ncbi:hypothetical protein UFOVP22_25 [uncultured Caudovirales phage]|uniref:Uncharacterized protein n=1 Tax=uncultured Caudovirales phage TaxID=2100421 RepID=A0A6J5T7U9_9CAUD|nr:hypothetical protein UFOVP22_25 [uncultured Caudovirales phage]